MRTKPLHMACLAIVFFMFSCQKEATVTEPKNDEISSLTSYLIKKGFKPEDVVFKDNNFIIEKDIVISKDDLAARVQKENTSVQTEHWRGTYLVSSTYITNVKLYIDPAVPAAWVTAIQGAIANWNAINGTSVGMSIVSTQSAANTRVFMGFESANWIARATLPSSSRRPGTTVEINSNFNSLAASQKLFAITHELGHTIGFYHTDQTQGIFITGTPTVDANSVMNSFVLPWNGFTAGDILATQILYP
jgi:hypothetical protein